MAQEQKYIRRLPQDEIIYFFLIDRLKNGDPSNDRGGLTGDRYTTGFDPSDPRYYHGGDLAGAILCLPYIKSLGATTILTTPVLKNKPVQWGGASFHGYWPLDFTNVDPHLGTNELYKQFVDEAHALNMKVYMDVVVKQTADVNHYVENDGNCELCKYRTIGDYPWQTSIGADGPPINHGFLGHGPGCRTRENFQHVCDTNWAYHVYIRDEEKSARFPDELNKLTSYISRGGWTAEGEGSVYGDLCGLNSLWLENPVVADCLISVYCDWIEKFKVDGFRIDAAKHVPASFVDRFVPAMLERARECGIPNFHIFGEVSANGPDAGITAQHTRDRALPHVIDFPFAIAVGDIVMGRSGTNVLAKVFAADVNYKGGAKKATRMPTFVSNHDRGRVAWYIRQAFPNATDDEVLKRVILAHALMFLLRGVPMLYYGDEQGFVGAENGIDCGAREDMFPSQVASYNNERLIGTSATIAEPNFNEEHPIFRAIQELAALRQQEPALRRGQQIVRRYSDRPGLFAVSRIERATGRELLIVFNTSTERKGAQIETDTASRHFKALRGQCATEPTVPGSYHVELEGLDYLVCIAERHEQVPAGCRNPAITPDAQSAFA